MKELRSRYPRLNIQVDGGVDEHTIGQVAAAGGNIIVSGSGIFKSQDPARTIALLRKTVSDSLA